MRAIVATEPGGPEVLQLREIPDAVAGPGEVLVRVTATAVNRADLLQRMGFYPPPPGAPDTIGLECSGTVEALGEGVTGWSVGDEVCALLAGGGYAELVAVPVGQVMPVPAGVSLVEAAALPEVACTVWSNVFMEAGLQPGERFLVHGGSGGIGTFAIQLASALGAKVYATAGSAAKLRACQELGADVAINYHVEDFVDVLSADGGADVILDNMGAVYLGRNVEALDYDGRLVIIGMQGGTRGELDVARLMRQRGTVIAATLRARPLDQKSAICADVVEHVWPLVADGQVRPVVHTMLPLADATAAHALMESSDHIGKILLTA
jgi:putative PIG3 family NAD(P)H quinone oxidoreductase